MTLLLAEGFDTRTATVAGSLWVPTGVGFGSMAYVAGRVSGYAMRNTSVAAGLGTGFKKAIPASTTLVVGMALRMGVNYASSNWAPLDFLLSNSTSTLHLMISTSSQNISVYRGNISAAFGTHTLLGTTSGVPFPIDTVTWQYVEVKVVASTGTGGSVTIRQNGTETLNVTGLNTGATSFGQVNFRNASTNVHGNGAYADPNSGTFDDIYVCDGLGSVNNDFLGDVQVYGLWPDGNGANSGLTGSDGNSTDNYLLVDDASAGVPTTADYVGGATPGTKDTYTYTDLSAGVVVKGVQIDSYAAKSDAGAISGRNIAFDGTNTVTGSDAVLSTSYTGVSTLLENALDGAAWTFTKVNAAQFGWEVRS